MREVFYLGCVIITVIIIYNNLLFYYIFIYGYIYPYIYYILFIIIYNNYCVISTERNNYCLETYLQKFVLFKNKSVP